MDTLAIIKELLVENLDVEEGLITEEATFESLGVDSLDMVELICELEEKCEMSQKASRPSATLSRTSQAFRSRPGDQFSNSKQRSTKKLPRWGAFVLLAADDERPGSFVI